MCAAAPRLLGGASAARLQPGLDEQLAQRCVDSGESLPLGELPGRRARHDDDVVTRARAPASAWAKASLSRRFTRLRSIAPPTLRDTDRPSRGRSAAGLGNE